MLYSMVLFELSFVFFLFKGENPGIVPSKLAKIGPGPYPGKIYLNY